RIFVDRTQDNDSVIEKLLTAYVDNNIDQYPISRAYAAGLHSFLERPGLASLAVKGQITGPISFGLSVPDTNGRAIIYDDIFSDLAAKMLRLRAAWQEKRLREISERTIIFVDEPYMASFGSAFVPLTKERVTNLLAEVLGGLSGLKGVHCCGNTDWPVLLETGIDIISFDTYNYARSFTLYPAAVKKFLDRQGAIAWGIVPNTEEALAGETVASLKDRLEEAMAPFTRHGIRFEQLVKHGLLTPSCTLGVMTSVDSAARALELLAELSSRLRKQYL
ncbi:MAG: methionine synthase, partial [Dehalococcoidales bacterium]|nr:methionine synthase [Dehalococcoidales bacterium]